MSTATKDDANAARQHIQTLRDSGWTIRAIAQATGVNTSKLCAIANRQQERIRRPTLERITALALATPAPPRQKSGPAPRVHTIESARPRFLASVLSMNPGECWPWGGKLWKGYGKFFYDYRDHQAHRVSYELFVGPIAEGLEIDHLCRNPPCVNPEHLEAVTPLENQRRRAAATTHCPRGHAYSAENTYAAPSKTPGGVRRTCRRCNAASQRRYYARRKLTSTEGGAA